jgi:hypothetical protein
MLGFLLEREDGHYIMDKILEVEMRLDGMVQVLKHAGCPGSSFRGSCEGNMLPVVEVEVDAPKYYHMMCEKHIESMKILQPGSKWKVYGR